MSLNINRFDVVIILLLILQGCGEITENKVILNDATNENDDYLSFYRIMSSGDSLPIHFFVDTFNSINEVYGPGYIYYTIGNKRQNEKSKRTGIIFVEGVFDSTNISILINGLKINKDTCLKSDYNLIFPSYIYNLDSNKYKNKTQSVSFKFNTEQYVSIKWNVLKYPYLRAIYIKPHLMIVFSNKYPIYK